jgi:hypothetical protein
MAIAQRVADCQARKLSEHNAKQARENAIAANKVRQAKYNEALEAAKEVTKLEIKFEFRRTSKRLMKNMRNWMKKKASPRTAKRDNPEPEHPLTLTNSTTCLTKRTRHRKSRLKLRNRSITTSTCRSTLKSPRMTSEEPGRDEHRRKKFERLLKLQLNDTLLSQLRQPAGLFAFKFGFRVVRFNCNYNNPFS